MNKNIAIIGGMGAGKTTLANELTKKHGYIPHHLSSGVKAIAHMLFNMETKDRNLLQAIGQKMREIDPDVWINNLNKSMIGKNTHVIDDIRYQNEAAYYKAKNYLIIGLNCSSQRRFIRLCENNMYTEDHHGWLEFCEDSTHSSEIQITELIKEYADIILDTTQSPAELLKTIEEELE